MDGTGNQQNGTRKCMVTIKTAVELTRVFLWKKRRNESYWREKRIKEMMVWLDDCAITWTFSYESSWYCWLTFGIECYVWSPCYRHRPRQRPWSRVRIPFCICMADGPVPCGGASASRTPRFRIPDSGLGGAVTSRDPTSIKTAPPQFIWPLSSHLPPTHPSSAPACYFEYKDSRKKTERKRIKIGNRRGSMYHLENTYVICSRNRNNDFRLNYPVNFDMYRYIHLL